MNTSKRITEILVEKLGIAETEVTPDANFIKGPGYRFFRLCRTGDGV